MKHALTILIAGTMLTSCIREPEGADGASPAAKGTTSRASDDSKSSGAAGKPTSRPSGKDPAEKQPAEKQPEAPKKVGAADRLDEKTYEHFGAGVAAAGEAIKPASLASKSGDFADKRIRVTGKIESVCKRKGCWMYVSDGENKVHVTFRDYGFFVPKDCEGREAVIDGTFTYSETSVADQKHYLEDEGKHEEAAKITKPKLQMKIKADGVALKKAE